MKKTTGKFFKHSALDNWDGDIERAIKITQDFYDKVYDSQNKITESTKQTLRDLYELLTQNGFSINYASAGTLCYEFNNQFYFIVFGRDIVAIKTFKGRNNEYPDNAKNLAELKKILNTSSPFRLKFF